MQVASEIGCGSLEIRLAAGGRANLFTTEPCCLLVDDELLKQINCTSSIVIATSPNFSFARAAQRIATVKSAPFAVAQSQLEAVINILKERGPILQARPVRTPTVGVLYTDPVSGERARQCPAAYAPATRRATVRLLPAQRISSAQSCTAERLLRRTTNPRTAKFTESTNRARIRAGERTS